MTNKIPLQAPGHMGVDYESRVDFDRLRKYRIGRAKESLNNSKCGSFLLFDFTIFATPHKHGLAARSAIK